MESHHYISDQRNWDLPDLLKIKGEREEAGKKGLEALRRLATSMIHKISCERLDTQALWLRQALLSLYGGHKVNMEAAVGNLNWDIRRDFGLVILGIYTPPFADYTIREAMIEAGDVDAAWFLAGLKGFYESPLDENLHPHK